MQMKFFRLLPVVFIFSLPVLLMAQAKQKAKPATKAATAKSKTLAKPSIADTGTQPFQLIISAKGFKDSTAAIIFHPSNQQYQGPNGFVKNEKVVLQGTIPQPDVFVLVLTDNKDRANDKYFNLYLDNQHSEISLDPTSHNVKVVSGKLMQEFDDLIKAFGPQFDELTRLSQTKQQAQQNGQPVDSLDKRFAQVSAQVNQQIPAFITKHASSPVSAFLLYTTRPVMSLDQLQRNLALLQGEAASNIRAAELAEYVHTEAYLRQGAPAPEFTQADTLGKPVSLSSFKGKYVLVDFWASWCGPCRMENPNVVNAFNQYKDKGFTVLGVSLDKDKNKWLQAIHDDRLSWTHVSDLQYWQNAVAQQYRVQSIPQNLLIGPDGKIVAKNLRGEALDAYLKDLLK